MVPALVIAYRAVRPNFSREPISDAVIARPTCSICSARVMKGNTREQGMSVLNSRVYFFEQRYDGLIPRM